MTLGFEGKNGVRNPGLEEAQGVLNVFFNHGHTELDTARQYGEGTSEEVNRIFDEVCRAFQIDVRFTAAF
jgi:aflatoxin B1 aldehyde reductase